MIEQSSVGGRPKNIGFLRFFLCLQASASLLGCEMVGHEAPPPPPQIVVADPGKKIIPLEKAGNYPKALEEAKLLKVPREKSKWTEKILRDWSLFEIIKAQSMYKTGHIEDAAILVNQALERQPDLIKRPAPELTPDIWTNFLLSKVNDNQEFWVLQSVGANGLLTPSEQNDMAFRAYLHLSERRALEKKFHAALVDIKRALNLHPTDPSALAVMKSLQDLQKAWTDKGYLEFTRQHLHRALFYWQKVIDLDPGDQDVKKNILKTKDLLKKLELIEQESGPSAVPGLTR
ncbi:MAG: tetratricopeptide repeat protein [Leptospirales bacterium]